MAPLPFNSEHLLFGTATPSFAAGTPGKVAVVAVGPLAQFPSGGSQFPFAFRNKTDAAISHVEWSATARSNGALVATGKSVGIDPAQLPPGAVGLAYINFGLGTKAPPANAKYEFSVQTVPADKSSYNTASLKVTKASHSGASIVGTATNTTGARLQGPYSVDVYCFGAGKLLSEYGAFADQDSDVEPNGTVSFTANLYGASCPTFVVGVSGYFA